MTRHSRTAPVQPAPPPARPGWRSVVGALALGLGVTVAVAPAQPAGEPPAGSESPSLYPLPKDGTPPKVEPRKWVVAPKSRW